MRHVFERNRARGTGLFTRRVIAAVATVAMLAGVGCVTASSAAAEDATGALEQQIEQPVLQESGQEDSQPVEQNLMVGEEQPSYAFQHCLCHVCPCCVHGHTDKHGSRVRVIVWRSFSHQIWKIKNSVFSKIFYVRLLCHVIFRSEDFFIPPLVARRRTKHAPHQMIVSVCVRK